MTLGERMIRVRAKLRLSQSELAKLLDTYPQAINRIENEKGKLHKANEFRLSEALATIEAREGIL